MPSDEGPQGVAGFVTPGLVDLRRIDVGQSDFHLATARIDDEAVAVLDPNDGLGGDRGGKDHARNQ